MHSVKLKAFSRHAGPHQLAHAVILGQVYILSPYLVELVSHGLCHQLAAQYKRLYLQILPGIDSHFQGHLRNAHGIGGGGHQQGGLKILHVHQLLLGIAGRGRNHRGAYLLQSIVKSQGACEHAVPKANLGHILVRGASCHGQAGHTFLPHLQVILRISHHSGLSRRAAGRMDSAQFLPWNRKQAIGVIIPHILFRHKRKLLQILQCLYMLRPYTCLLHLGAVCRYLPVNPVHRVFQAVQLYRFNLRPGHCLLFCPNHVV